MTKFNMDKFYTGQARNWSSVDGGAKNGSGLNSRIIIIQSDQNIERYNLEKSKSWKFKILKSHNLENSKSWIIKSMKKILENLEKDQIKNIKKWKIKENKWKKILWYMVSSSFLAKNRNIPI